MAIKNFNGGALKFFIHNKYKFLRITFKEIYNNHGTQIQDIQNSNIKFEV